MTEVNYRVCIFKACLLRRELQNGVVLLDEQNNEVGISKKAAFVGISAVLVSRIAMATPGMSEYSLSTLKDLNTIHSFHFSTALTPLLMENLEKRGFLKKYPRLNAPIQTLFVGFVLLFATPLGCAFFSQRAAIKVDSLEPEVKEAIKKKNPDLETVWYNKGL